MSERCQGALSCILSHSPFLKEWIRPDPSIEGLSAWLPLASTWYEIFLRVAQWPSQSNHQFYLLQAVLFFETRSMEFYSAHSSDPRVEDYAVASLNAFSFETPSVPWHWHSGLTSRAARSLVRRSPLFPCRHDLTKGSIFGRNGINRVDWCIYTIELREREDGTSLLLPRALLT